jgi:hypothetical protein
MVGAILGGATALVSGISAIASFQQAKQRDQDAARKANEIMGIEEVDKMAALQSPDISSLRLQRTAQQSATGTRTLQEMGQEAAIGGVANLYQATAQDAASAVTEQNAMDAQIAAMKAQNAQEVAYRNIARKEAVLGFQLAGAQQASADAYNQYLAGITGIAKGVGMAAGDIIGMSNPYGSSDSSPVSSSSEAKRMGLTEEQIKLLSNPDLLSFT